MARKASTSSKKTVASIPAAKSAAPPAIPTAIPTASTPALTPALTPAPVVTAVRNSPIPKPVVAPAPAKKELTFDRIARRAYEISQSAEAGDETSNWLRAERELRGI